MTPRYNQTRASIEQAIASSEYGLNMTRAAERYHHRGNLAAANAAEATATNIRNNITNALAILPLLTPEHAELLNQEERLDLATRLTAAASSLESRLSRMNINDGPAQAPDETESRRYLLCLHASHLAHIARSTARHADNFEFDENYTDNAQYAMRRCLEEARDALNEINALPATPHPPFQKDQRKALKAAQDHLAEIARMYRVFQLRQQRASAAADNSPGPCLICGAQIRADDAGSHVAACTRLQLQRSTHPPLQPDQIDRMPVLVRVRSTALRHWLILAVNPAASLDRLDTFLRDRWLNCCEHGSHFELPPATEDPDVPQADPTTAFQRSAGRIPLIFSYATAPGQITYHSYDHENPTGSSLEHLERVSHPYAALAALVTTPEQSEPHTDQFVTVLAHNQTPELCFRCDAAAAWRYHVNPYLDPAPGPSAPPSALAPPYFCTSCAPRETAVTPLRNSPRAGTACYDVHHNNPVHLGPGPDPDESTHR